MSWLLIGLVFFPLGWLAWNEERDYRRRIRRIDELQRRLAGIKQDLADLKETHTTNSGWKL